MKSHQALFSSSPVFLLRFFVMKTKKKSSVDVKSNQSRLTRVKDTYKREREKPRLQSRVLRRAMSLDDPFSICYIQQRKRFAAHTHTRERRRIPAVFFTLRAPFKVQEASSTLYTTGTHTPAHCALGLLEFLFSPCLRAQCDIAQLLCVIRLKQRKDIEKNEFNFATCGNCIFTHQRESI